MTLVPAYGRDYTSAKAVKADWDAGKDFIIRDISSRYDGSYINKQDAERDMKGQSLTFRYKRLAQIVVIKV